MRQKSANGVFPSASRVFTSARLAAPQLRPAARPPEAPRQERAPPPRRSGGRPPRPTPRDMRPPGGGEAWASASTAALLRAQAGRPPQHFATTCASRLRPCLPTGSFFGGWARGATSGGQRGAASGRCDNRAQLRARLPRNHRAPWPAQARPAPPATAAERRLMRVPSRLRAPPVCARVRRGKRRAACGLACGCASSSPPSRPNGASPVECAHPRVVKVFWAGGRWSVVEKPRQPASRFRCLASGG